MNNPLDDLINTLQQPPLQGELDGLPAAIDAMHRSLLNDSEPHMPSTPSLSRRRRFPVATLIAAGVLGFAGVAAAGPVGLLSNDAGEPTTAAETTLEPTTTAAPTTTVPPTTDASTTTDAADLGAVTGDEVTDQAESLVDDPSTVFDETQCAEGHHGQTVSSVAKETDPGPGHGQAVSDAAHSSCGKSVGDATDQDDVDAEDVGAGDLGAVPADETDDVRQDATHRNDRSTGEHGNSSHTRDQRGNGHTPPSD